MRTIEIVFDDNSTTKQLIRNCKEFKDVMICFYKRSVCNFGSVMFVDFSKVKVVRVIEHNGIKIEPLQL